MPGSMVIRLSGLRSKTGIGNFNNLYFRGDASSPLTGRKKLKGGIRIWKTRTYRKF